MKPSPIPASRFQPFDLLATLVAVVHGDGRVQYANAALEDALGMSRRSIEGSDLQAEGGGVLTLSATLRNRAGFEQALPAVELTLTDLRDQPLLRRVLQPRDYLGPLTPSAPGIPAGGEIQLRVPFDVAEAHPAGYRLYVFYP